MTGIKSLSLPQIHLSRKLEVELRVDTSFSRKGCKHPAWSNVPDVVWVLLPHRLLCRSWWLLCAPWWDTPQLALLIGTFRVSLLPSTLHGAPVVTDSHLFLWGCGGQNGVGRAALTGLGCRSPGCWVEDAGIASACQLDLIKCGC